MRFVVAAFAKANWLVRVRADASQLVDAVAY
jgi:hypothetical protein